MPVHIDELQTDIELLGGSTGNGRDNHSGGAPTLDPDRLRQTLRPLIEAELAAAFDTWRRARR